MRESAVPPSDLVSSVARALRRAGGGRRVTDGLTTKQIARRCDITVAAAYRMLRTLAHTGYVLRRDDGGYMLGLAVADRFRELVAAMRGPAEVGEVLRRGRRRDRLQPLPGQLRRAAGWRSPPWPRAHARPTSRTLCPASTRAPTRPPSARACWPRSTRVSASNYLKEHGMRAFTQATLRSPSGARGRHRRGPAPRHAGRDRTVQAGRGLRVGLRATAGELLQRYVVACALPAVDLMKQAPVIRERLHATARTLQAALNAPLAAAPGATAA